MVYHHQVSLAHVWDLLFQHFYLLPHLLEIWRIWPERYGLRFPDACWKRIGLYFFYLARQQIANFIHFVWNSTAGKIVHILHMMILHLLFFLSFQLKLQSHFHIFFFKISLIEGKRSNGVDKFYILLLGKLFTGVIMRNWPWTWLIYSLSTASAIRLRRIGTSFSRLFHRVNCIEVAVSLWTFLVSFWRMFTTIIFPCIFLHFNFILERLISPSEQFSFCQRTVISICKEKIISTNKVVQIHSWKLFRWNHIIFDSFLLT